MQYIKIKKDIVTEHICLSDNPSGEGWIKLDGEFQGAIGMSVKLLDEANGYILKPLAQLIDEGLVQDHRGLWFDKETKEEYKISEIGSLPDKNWTRETPLGVPCEVFRDGKWIEDADKKLKYDSTMARSWRNEELRSVVDLYQRPLLWSELSAKDQQAVKTYRRELLDYPDREGFPYCDKPSTNLQRA